MIKFAPVAEFSDCSVMKKNGK